MNDDAPSTGAPKPSGDAATPPPPPTPFEPNKTVMRPTGAHAADSGATVITPGSGPVATGPADASDDLATFGGFADAPPPEGDDANGPIDPEFPTKASKAGITGAIVAVGTGLLGAAAVIAGIRSRMTDDGDLDWSNYGVGLGATAVLLIVALLGAVTARRRTGGRAREEVVTWPGVVGILSAAVMLNIGIDSDESWLGYLTGAVLVVLAVLGYVAARRAAFVVVALLGLAIIYGLLFDDFVADSVGDSHQQVTAAVVVAVFVVAMTLLGWALPSRAVSGVVVGAAGVVGFAGIMVSFLIARFLGPLFTSFMSDFGGSEPGAGAAPAAPELGFEETDIWLVLGLAAVLTLLWALAAAVSNHPGFSILAIVMPTILVPMASFALAVEHPTWWAAILASAGGLLLLGGTGLSRLRGKSVARSA